MENAKKVRNVLLKTFVFTFLLLIFSSAVYVIFNDAMIAFASKLYGLNEEQFKMIMFNSLAFMKISAFMFFLFPAIAIHCEYVKCCCGATCGLDKK